MGSWLIVELPPIELIIQAINAGVMHDRPDLLALTNVELPRIFILLAEVRSLLL